MGSKSDWDVMSAACQTLEEFGVSYEKKVISAHRTPQFFCEYMASARDRGVGIVIAGAGGAVDENGGAKPAGRQRGKGLLQPFVSQKMGQSHQIFRN